MARGNGLPFSIRNWAVEVLGRTTTEQTEVWIRVKGLTSLSYGSEAETQEGAGEDSAWKEPYIARRGARIKLSGRPIYSQADGAPDAGQAELDYMATMVGFEADTAIRLSDPYGHALRLDAIVTEAGNEAGDTGEERSWTLELVGEPVELPYVQLSGMKLLKGSAEATEVSIAVGATQKIGVQMTPGNASNLKYSVASADASRVKIRNVDGLSFELYGAGKTTSAVSVLVKSMNNQLEKTLMVTVG